MRKEIDAHQSITTRVFLKGVMIAITWISILPLKVRRAIRTCQMYNTIIFTPQNNTLNRIRIMDYTSSPVAGERLIVFFPELSIALTV